MLIPKSAGTKRSFQWFPSKYGKFKMAATKNDFLDYSSLKGSNGLIYIINAEADNYSIGLVI